MLQLKSRLVLEVLLFSVLPLSLPFKQLKAMACMRRIGGVCNNDGTLWFWKVGNEMEVEMGMKLMCMTDESLKLILHT